MRKNCKLGVVVIPRDARHLLGIECLKALRQFTSVNREIKYPLEIYFDQGMFESSEKAYKFVDSLEFENSTFHLNENSKKVLGIQLADLCAHTCSIMLKDTLGLITKKVKAGENSGYDPDDEIELGFEMWSSLRYSFFNQGNKKAINDPIEDYTVNVEPHGLYLSNLCKDDLLDRVKTTFERVYLGCIH